MPNVKMTSSNPTFLGITFQNPFKDKKELNKVIVIAILSFSLLGYIYGLTTGLIIAAAITLGFLIKLSIKNFPFSSSNSPKDKSNYLSRAKAVEFCQRVLRKHSLEATQVNSILEQIKTSYDNSPSIGKFIASLKDIIEKKENLSSKVYDSMRNRLSHHFVNNLLVDKNYAKEKIKEILEVCKAQNWDEPLSGADLVDIFEKGFLLIEERDHKVSTIYDIHYFMFSFLSMEPPSNPADRQPLTPQVFVEICNYYDITRENLFDLQNTYYTNKEQFLNVISMKRYQEIVDNKDDYPIDHIPPRGSRSSEFPSASLFTPNPYNTSLFSY